MRSRFPLIFSSCLAFTTIALTCNIGANAQTFSDTAFSPSPTTKKVRFHPGHYVLMNPMYYGLDQRLSLDQHDRLVEETFSNLGPKFRGVQIAYPWKLLEPSPGMYDLSCISRHLEIARRYNKHLIVQLQTVGFGTEQKCKNMVPAWLKGSPNPAGGNYSAFFKKLHEIKDPNDPSKTTLAIDDIQPVSWDPLIHNQQLGLYRAVAQLANNDRNSQSLELINLIESAASSRRMLEIQKDIYPLPSNERLVDLFIEKARTLNATLRHTIGMQYLNFFFGGKESVVSNRMKEAGIGFGFPDLDPDDIRYPGLHRKVYPLVRQATDVIPTLGSVQYGDALVSKKPVLIFDDRNNVIQTLRFGKDDLKLNYITWYGMRKYIETVRSVLSDPTIVNQTDPAGGLNKKYPRSIAPFLWR